MVSLVKNRFANGLDYAFMMEARLFTDHVIFSFAGKVKMRMRVS